ncbi:hypothetical protein EK21DRAFT_19143, partial [Setomelanomma holmii]
ASEHRDVDALQAALKDHYSDPKLTAVDLHTGINLSRRAVLVCTHGKITIACEGS